MLRFHRVLWLMLLPIVLVPAAETVPTNLLGHGGFEQAVSAAQVEQGPGWRFADDRAPQGWAFNNAHPGTVTLLTGTAAEGQQFLRLGNGWMFQLVSPPLEYREDLHFRVKARGKGQLELVTYLYARASGECLGGETLRTQELDAAAWQEVDGVYSCTDDKVLRFALHTTGEIDLDDARVTLEPRLTPAFTEVQGLRSAERLFAEEVAVPDDAASATTWLRSGPQGVKVVVEARDGSRKTLTIKPFNGSLPPPTAASVEPVSLPLAGLEVAELGLRLYRRPNLAMLKPEARTALLKEWDTLPSPLSQRVSLAFRQDGDEVECRFDGGYAGALFRGSKLRSIRFIVNPGSALGQTGFESTARAAGFFPIELARQDRPGAWTAAAVALTAAPVLQRVPILPPSAANLDLGLTARQQAVVESYTYRSAFDALPESFIFTVPRAQYSRAWVLCGVEDDPGRDPALTARLTRFVSQGPYSGRARDCLADTTVRLPRGQEQAGEGVTVVGVVTVGGSSRPLYLVEIPLRSGDIQDLLFDEVGDQQRGTFRGGPYLDFELLGRLRPQDRPHPFTDDRFYPDARYVSGVHVFGVTLEAAPVEMEIRQTQPGNIFHNAEVAELVVALRPRRDGDYSLRWSVRDVEGKAVGGGERALALRAAGGEQRVTVALAQPQLGWYEVECELWQGERKLLSHRAALALLGPDTRQAGFESPYSNWWFTDWHYATADPAIAGPILSKAGFRRAMICPLKPHLTEAKLVPWRLTAASVMWGAPYEMMKKGASDAEVETYVRDALADYPSVRHAMVFHESAPKCYDVAPELLGVKPDPKLEAADADERWQYATRYAQILRRFPQLQIVIGNSLVSTELLAEGLRRGFPEALADYIGNEGTARNGLPERLWGSGIQHWSLRETARIYGYRTWGVGASVESVCRLSRLIGAERMARYLVRDGLISHAYRAPQISLGGLHDAGNSYNDSFWGEGLCQRYPLLYPKPAYVAIATLTRVLDRVELQREVPTGSNSVYALEFARADGKRVYALWAARGTAALTLDVEGAAKVDIIDLYGRTVSHTRRWRDLRLSVGGAATYLVSDGRVESIRCGERTYPDDLPPGNLQVANRMDRSDEWELKPGQDPLLEHANPPHLPFRTAGEFVLRAVRDEERGNCLEVELIPTRPLPALLSEYTVLRLKQPPVLSGEPSTLGLWVKGNSGWGQVYWEIEDAKGIRRVSCGTTVHGGEVMDYDGSVSIDFDGWCFLQMQISDASPLPERDTGSVQNRWNVAGDLALTYPLKLTGIAVSVPQQALHLTEMAPIRQVLRFRDLSASE